MHSTSINAAKRVAVTGGNGYIAMHVIAQLLMDQHHVISTVRNERSRAQVIEGLQELELNCGELYFSYCELNDDRSWVNTFEGVDQVVHLASPFPLNEPEDAEALIETAVKGTLHVLEAAKQCQVKRFLLISSTAAILYGHEDKNRLFTSDDWSQVEADGIGVYQKSKTLAERSAWKWLSEQTDMRMEFSVVNPGLVLGPYLGDTISTSGELIRKFMAGQVPAVPDMGWACVDVRDLAAAIVAALGMEHFAGHRLICAGNHTHMRDIARILRHQFGKERKIPQKEIPGWLVKLVALFDKDVRITLNDLGRQQNVDVHDAERLLGFKSRPVEESILDMAECMVRKGLV